VENAPVRVEVRAFEMTELAPETPCLMGFRVVCGGGTYVRSLAHDLGQRLGCGAHLNSLRRLRSGDFGITQAVPMERAGAADLTPMENLFLQWLNKQGEFLAVAAAESGWARPRVVLTSSTSVDAGEASLHRAENGI
jgi:tRNA U55 pseudouridine synthase TruB